MPNSLRSLSFQCRVLEQVAQTQFGGRKQITRRTVRTAGQLNGNLCGLEGGNRVLVLRLRDHLLLGAVFQMEAQLVGRVAEQGAALGQGDLGRGWIADIGQKYAAPQRAAAGRNYVLYIKHDVLELFVEDPRLYLKRRLRRLQPLLQMVERVRRFWRHIDGVEHSQHPRSNGKNGDRADEHSRPNATGPHGSNFAVGRQAAQPHQNADQHTHRQGDDERRRQCEKENFRHTRQGSAVTDDQLQQPSQVPHEDDEGEQRHAQQSVRADFLQDVAGEDAHKGLVYRKEGGKRQLPKLRAVGYGSRSSVAGTTQVHTTLEFALTELSFTAGNSASVLPLIFQTRSPPRGSKPSP